MSQLSRTQCENVLFFYFLGDGWLPPGTTEASWQAVTFGELHMDDPPLPDAPDLQKQRVALDLQHAFHLLGGSLPSPLAELQDRAMTLGSFVAWCVDHQGG